MKKYCWLIIGLFGLLHAQQVQYCLENKPGDGTDTLSLYMQSTDSLTVDVAATNFSIVFKDTCNQAPEIIFDEFLNNWGNFVLRQDTAYGLAVAYNNVTYSARWQYANADTNFLNPTFVVLPVDTATRRLVMQMVFQGTCSYDVYMEDVNENPVAQLGSAFFRPISYAISRQLCDSCQAAWTAIADSASKTVTFTNASVYAPGPTTFTWDFGDGTTADSLNPSHQYASPGNYIVSLIISGNGCSDTMTSTVRIPAPVCDASFTYNTISDLVVAFRGQSLADTVQWHWDFGDGGTDTVADPVHRYENPGRYEVCASVLDPLTGCGDTICDTVTMLLTHIEPLENPIRIAPNPFDDQAKLVLGKQIQGDVSITLYDLTGKRVFSRKLNAGNGNITLDLQTLPSGAFYLELSDRNSMYRTTLIKR